LQNFFRGPSSDCGAGGQTIVRGEGDIEFIFRNSLLSNNGTDVDVGQIPEIYYRLVNENSPNKENSKVQKQSHGMETESDKAYVFLQKLLKNQFVEHQKNCH
jgi:RCR-type E3 ubiquitin transferase